MLAYAIWTWRDDMKMKYVVVLSDADRKHLQERVSKDHHAAYKIKHANILR